MSSAALLTAAEEALAKLNHGGGVWTLQRLPSAEQTDVWNALNSIFGLSALELQALKDAKRNNRVPVTVSLKYSNRKAVELTNIFKDEISGGYLKSEAILCGKTWIPLSLTSTLAGTTLSTTITFRDAPFLLR
jgi:hypothetical protein